MFLIDEIDILKKKLCKIRDMEVSTPIVGEDIRDNRNLFFDFMGTMVIARRIVEKIDKCDPKRKTFRCVKKQLEYYVGDKNLKTDIKPIGIKSILDKIIHSSFLEKRGDIFLVANDYGYVFSVSVEDFLDALASLCIEKNGAIMVMCDLFEKSANEIENLIKEKFANRLQDSWDNNEIEINNDILNDICTDLYMDDSLYWKEFFLMWLSSYCGGVQPCREPDVELRTSILKHFFKEGCCVEDVDFRGHSFMFQFEKLKAKICIMTSKCESGKIENFRSEKSVLVGKFVSIVRKYHADRYFRELNK